MDQNFNDLAAYEETIENYIKTLKELSKGTEVVIYLVYFPHFPKNPHPSTYSSKIISILKNFSDYNWKKRGWGCQS